jgi:hypothetical protein
LVCGPNPNRRATGRQTADAGNRGGNAKATGGVMGNPAEIIQFQKKQDAKFICSACGADRGCDCNAPAVEKLAELREQNRQRQAKHAQKKREQKQQTSNVSAERATGSAEVDIEQRRAKYAALGDTDPTACILSPEDELEPHEYRPKFLLRALDAIYMAVYSGPVDQEVIAAAEGVVTAWQNFTQELKAKNEAAED